jgi:hypothetical protein
VEQDLPEILKDGIASGMSDITWYRLSDTCIICHGFDAGGRDTLGIAVGGAKTAASLLCRRALHDAIARGEYDEIGPLSGEKELEAI